jgi:hypothetical protein
LENSWERCFDAGTLVRRPRCRRCFGFGRPNIYTDHGDAFLRACEETETVINLHVGSSSSTIISSRGFPSGIAGNALFGKRWGMTPDRVVDTVCFGSIFGSPSSLQMVEDTVGKTLESW